MGGDPQGTPNEISGGLQSLAGYLMISDDFCRYIMIYQDISTSTNFQHRSYQRIEVAWAPPIVDSMDS
jgi:hypothetical protein